MNIMIEGGDLNPPFAEGTRKIARIHAMELKRRGHNVIIFTRDTDAITNTKHPKFEVIDGIKFYRWGSYIDLLNTYRLVIQKEKINLVHIFLKGTRPSYYIWFLKHLGGKRIPVVMTLLGYPIFDKRYTSLKKADLVVIPSDFIYHKLKLKNSIHLHYGIDINESKDDNEKKEDIILCLRFPSIPLIRAFKQLSQERKGLRLILNKNNVNNNPWVRDEYRMENNITELGYSDIAYMKNLMKKSKILVDFHTGMLYKGGMLICASPPLLILEAMSHRMGILSNDLPEIREVVINNTTGILLEREATTKIYEALKKLLDDYDYGKISLNAQHDAQFRFDIKWVMPEYERLYLELKR